MRRSAASAELTRQVEKSTPVAYERVISVVTDQGTEKWLLTSLRDDCCCWRPPDSGAA